MARPVVAKVSLILEGSRTVWGQVALNSMEICRRANGQTHRNYCHKVGKKKPVNTAKSWSPSRGCTHLKRCDLPCTFTYCQVRRALRGLIKKGQADMFMARALDHKKMPAGSTVSKDKYHFYIWRPNQ